MLQATYILNNHDQKRQLDAQSLLGVCGASDVIGAHVGAHDL